MSTKRIQLLPDPEIEKWWTDHAKDLKRQEKLRDAVKIGLQVIEGEKGIVSTEKQQLYEAIETLLRQGIIAQEPKKEPEQPKEEEPQKVDINLLRRSRSSIKQTIR
ncbi:hypothetical protein P4S91_26175 [Aneurinibacillus aneurinilyticus]|uniref:hypothetical protein n=1 Tax=Aneurinibacillus aneurinilyticus TaxID=1391 RepID=UPI0023F1EB8A|nr:hypothetical protein [Aneurinibacillus aneurinilyticus]MED0704809.1 hypothetical protein [Aneurinibacillus aneurinilyticus]MED0726337.1 hypothetical protein [Aneurinibacillus aneurinilyticus]